MLLTPYVRENRIFMYSVYVCLALICVILGICCWFALAPFYLARHVVHQCLSTICSRSVMCATRGYSLVMYLNIMFQTKYCSTIGSISIISNNMFYITHFQQYVLDQLCPTICYRKLVVFNNRLQIDYIQHVRHHAYNMLQVDYVQQHVLYQVCPTICSISFIFQNNMF